MKRQVLLIAVLVSTSVFACKPKVGGSCKVETKETCVDDKKALACHDGKWEELACKGPDGCSKATGEHICDQSVAEDKDVCNLNDDHVCTGDKRGMLQCTKNHWTLVQSCLGDRACSMENKKVICDNSIAKEGDSCGEEEDYACSIDKKTALACRKGVFVPASQCKGAKGCKVSGTKEAGFKVECDDSIAAQGDVCEKEDHYSCAVDEKAILRCKNKKFEIEDKCKSREKCAIRGGQVGCY
ncbi:MAG: hypothetical protein KIT84_09880 [Labilithrix sp.]|nr:hypothetical protein [Labilithrix sp.]MCW5811311.1 hypothetical protein [Labilithrix sp.]